MPRYQTIIIIIIIIIIIVIIIIIILTTSTIVAEKSLVKFAFRKISFPSILNLLASFPSKETFGTVPSASDTLIIKCEL